MVTEGNTEASVNWRGCGGPPESTGRGMQEKMCCRTQEAPFCSWIELNSGGMSQGSYMPMGCLIRHSTQRSGKPATRMRRPCMQGRDLTEGRSPQRKPVPDMSGWITRANLTAVNSNWILKRVTVKIRAEASPTEEPDAGKPHVRVCAGGAG